MTDLQKAYNRFKDISEKYDAYFAYYDGNQPLRYSTERLREAFDQIDVKFRQNWCAVVIDAALERMELYGWSAVDDNINNLLSDLWNSTGLAVESNEVHESAMICGESFLIGWQDEGQPVEFYYNDPRRCCVFYDDDHPKVKTFAAKWWDNDEGCQMVLYYPDRLEKYTARGKKMAEIDNMTGANVFRLESSETNPYGVIPVFHFRNSLRTTKSDLANVVELQDAINKLLCDMMVTAEFSAFPARYVISSADIQTLRNAPNQIWDLPAGIGDGQGTQVGTLEAANLANYSDQIDRLAKSIGIITRTPKHYFENTGSAVSGEALITMESSLVKKVEQKRELFGEVWQEVAQFALMLSGITIEKADVQPQWGNAESNQPLTETEVIKNYVGAGLPLKSSLRLAGYTEAEIATVEQEKAEEKQESSDLIALYLEQARNKTAQEDAI